jgi:hypothetical protein
MNYPKKTLVLGASDNPERYSYKAIHRLREKGHSVVAIGKKVVMVGDTTVDTAKKNYPEIDTITMYLSAKHQKEYYDYILSLNPKRIIFNPGAENEELTKIALENNIEPLEACTLVLLSVGKF